MRCWHPEQRASSSRERVWCRTVGMDPPHKGKKAVTFRVGRVWEMTTEAWPSFSSKTPGKWAATYNPTVLPEWTGCILHPGIHLGLRWPRPGVHRRRASSHQQRPGVHVACFETSVTGWMRRVRGRFPSPRQRDPVPECPPRLIAHRDCRKARGNR